MVKSILKISFILGALVILMQNIFGYQILVDAFLEESPNEVKYVLNMSAYKKSVELYKGNPVTYAVRGGTDHYTTTSDLIRTPYDFNYSGNERSVTAKKNSQGFITRADNANIYGTLPDFYSVSRTASIFHTKPGTNYNGSNIKVGYQSYKVDLNGNVQYFKAPNGALEAVISPGPSPTDMGIVGHEKSTEYQFRVDLSTGIYYGYHKIDTTSLQDKLVSIKTLWDDEAKPGRLYMSAVMSTKNDAYPLKDGHRSYSVNHVSVYTFLNLPKMRKSVANNGWGKSAVSGMWRDSNGQDTGVYDHQKSVVNMYDNVFQLALPEETKCKRTIYVQHLDMAGNILAAYKNPNAKMITPPGTQNTLSTSAYPQFQERYEIMTGERIEIRKSDKDGTEINGKKYNYKYGNAAKGFTMGSALVATPNFSWNTPTASFTTDASGKDDFVIIKLYYEEELIKPTERLDDLTLEGKLCFINELDWRYSSATTGDNVDYVPSTSGLTTTGRLTPYVNNAYPYVVRGLNYAPESRSYTANASIGTSIRYYYSKWVYNHVGDEDEDCPKLICGRSEHEHDDGCYAPVNEDGSGGGRICGRSEHEHGYSCYSYHDGCGWRDRGSTGTRSNTLYYSVPYKHNWYDIKNLKIYRLSHLDVYDNINNTGGVLFGGGTYRVDVSSTYERRFSYSSGLNNASITVNFPSSSYTLPTIYNDVIPRPANNTSTSDGYTISNESETIEDAETQIEEQTHEVAATRQNLTIRYEYHNDYVQLDSYRLSSTAAISMVDRNLKSWSEPIRTATVSERLLDSTKNSGHSADGLDNGNPIHYTSNLNNFMRPTSGLTRKYDFADNYQIVPINRENGIRELTGRLYYTLVRDPKYDISSDTFDATDYTYEINSTYPPPVYGQITPADLQVQNKYYIGDDVNKVNVFTPVSLNGLRLSSSERVDHTSGGISDRLTLQKNAFFTVSADSSSFNLGSYSFSDTREFVKGYYFICNFEIFYENEYGNLQFAPPFRAVYVDGPYAVFRAKPTSSVGSEAVDFSSNAIKVVAVTKNITDGLKEYYDTMSFTTTQYLELNNNTFTTSSSQRQRRLLTRDDIVADGYHAAYRIINSVNLGRIFDFAVTDCTDLVFKDVFRKTTNENVNEPTGNIYYSGIRRWDYDSLGYNDYLPRNGSNEFTLPLGPYKHTNRNIISAPKMGYRISYDLKTTGYMSDDNRNNSRRIRIVPSYYYISKDGSRFIENIRLFYKDQSGKYITFNNSGYKIYFRPNDGYRYLRDSEFINSFETMSAKLEALDVSGANMYLTNKMMGTNNDGFIQAWYGEYKLPNSTIAVEVDASGNYNINNLLTDGYIGVKFDIRSTDAGGYTIYYNTEDKSSTYSNNTSQWDYEGFLGLNAAGSSYSGSLRLEKGTWNINEATYDKIKGTVVLFDIDNRAADDFQ